MAALPEMLMTCHACNGRAMVRLEVHVTDHPAPACVACSVTYDVDAVKAFAAVHELPFVFIAGKDRRVRVIR
jgi:hypothetical protein